MDRRRRQPGDGYKITSGRFELITGAANWAQWEQRARSNELVLAFLADYTPVAPSAASASRER